MNGGRSHYVLAGEKGLLNEGPQYSGGKLLESGLKFRGAECVPS